MIAALPMYRWPETAGWTDALWAETRRRLRAAGQPAPEALGEPDWSGEVALAQICNLPWRRLHRARLRPAGCWDSGLPGLAPGMYASVFVVRRGAEPDPLAHMEAPFAVNEWDSHSGWGAPWGWAQARGATIARPYASGAHRASARDVAEGRAAMACIDLIAWELLTRHEPATAGALQRIAVTDESPGQTFATSGDPVALREALSGAIDAIGPEGRRALCLSGIAELAPAAYDGLPEPPAPPLRASAA